MNGSRLSRLVGLLLLPLACVCSTTLAQTPALTIDLDAEGVAASRFPWTLDKQVTPSAADRFIGESQEVLFRLVLTKGDPVAEFRVAGTARIRNDSGQTATLTSITGSFPGSDVVVACSPGTLDAGAVLECPIQFDVADGAGGTLGVVVATSGAVAGAEASTAIAFGAPQPVDDQVTVSDTLLDAPLTFDESGVHEYRRVLTCVDGNTQAIKNIATILETGANDSVRARVGCHAVRMGRDAAPTDRAWRWTLEKTHAEVVPLQLAAGQTHQVEYSITATATATEGGAGVVSGSITAINTNPVTDAQLLSVKAWIDGIAATVECPALVVPHATYDASRNIVLGRLVCPFTLALPDGHVPAQVTGEVTQQLFDYAFDGTASLDGTKVLSGSQPVAAGGGETDECVQLADVYLGATHDLGQFCAGAGSTTVTRNFTGPITVTSEDECAFQVPNLARLTANDSGTTAEDQTLIEVQRTDCAAPGVLGVELSARAAFERRFPWTIEKSATPPSADRFIGETQTFAYRLTLTKGEAEDAGFRVAGSARLHNLGMGPLDVAAISITYGGAPVVHSCAVGPLAPMTSRDCSFEFEAADDTTRTLTILVDAAGDVADVEESIEVVFGAPTTTLDSVTVTDTLLDAPLTFSASGTHEYTRDVRCDDGNTRTIDNTATIVETGASDSAQVRLSCHAIRMERAAQPAPEQRFEWALEKTHAEAEPLQLASGDTYRVDYTITATATAVAGEDGTVTGAIGVINTNPFTDAQLVSVKAWIDGIEATANCPSLVVPHATYDAASNIVLGRLTCPFTLTLPEGHVPTLVTGEVTQQLFDYAPDGTPTPDGTKVLSGSQPVSPAGAGTQTDECIALSDVYLGTTHDLGTFCASEGSTTVSRNFEGPIAVTDADECEFEVPNLARLTTNDSGTTVDDQTLVRVERTDCELPGAVAIELDAEGALSRRFPWTIEKSVTPEHSDRFIGETQELAYTLRLTKGEAQEEGFGVTGQARLVNGSDAAVTVAAIQVTYGGAPVAHSCSTGTLEAGATLDCPLSFTPADGTTRTLTVTFDLAGDAEDPSASTDVVFSESGDTLDSITVTDTLLDEPLTFSASGTHEYTHEVTCRDGNSIVVDNTATIVETGASDSARARVACHAIRLERSAQTGGDTRWNWTLQKSHAETQPLQLALGQTYLVDYTITATATAQAGADGQVTGFVAVQNTHPLVDAQLLSVKGWIDELEATVDCPSMTVPHATFGPGGVAVPGRLECPFTLALPDGHVPTLVRAEVVQQLFDYSASGVASANGTKVLSGSQPVSGGGGGTVTDECVQLSDVYLGSTHDLGEFCATEGNASVTRTFTGAVTVTGETECAFEVPNLARLVTDDSGTTVEDDTLLQVERTDCDVACTRTRGYWSTHSIYGPAPYDATWAQIGEDTPFFLATNGDDPVTWYQALWISPRGNAYWVLAPQFIAATLNLESGATAGTQVLDALDAAQGLFETHTPDEIGTLKGNSRLRQRFIELAGVLDLYNNGEGDLGAGHCSEDDTSRTGRIK